ncbi:MAG: hypothetical protein ABSH38_05850 [Verrucomicrobiota bacterium]
MKWNLEGTCPICGKSFPCAQLHAHIVAERPASRHQIMRSIQACHPQWIHEHGICQSCWDSYRQSPQGADAL